LTALLVIGCAPAAKKSVAVPKEGEAIVTIGRAYRDASNALKRGPTSEKELKPYLKKYGDPDQLLISPNDGQPYQFTWGLTPTRPTKSAVAHRFLVYEKTGKGGKRYAVDMMLKLYHLGAKEFAALQGSK
jgi:hypothetical protein